MENNWADSPVLMNLLYWSLLGLMAYFVSPVVLFALLVLPGFVSSPKVHVEHNGMTVTVEGKNQMTQEEIRAAIEEASR